MGGDADWLTPPADSICSARPVPGRRVSLPGARLLKPTRAGLARVRNSISCLRRRTLIEASDRQVGRPDVQVDRVACCRSVPLGNRLDSVAVDLNAVIEDPIEEPLILARRRYDRAGAKPEG